jgi:hypothetical protein
VTDEEEHHLAAVPLGDDARGVDLLGNRGLFGRIGLGALAHEGHAATVPPFYDRFEAA